jgi:ABC-type transport system substrate-binding protein
VGGQVGRRRLLLLASLLAGLLFVGALAACGGSSGGASGGGSSSLPKQGGTYNYPLSVDPFAFDPTLYPYEGVAVLHQVYEGLTRWEEQPDGTVKTAPCLAESWSANADATVWTIRLRRGVMFQAPVSREVTAADVVADLRYLTDRSHQPPGDSSAYMLAPIKGTDDGGYAPPARLGVTALDRYTVRFTLKSPFSEFADTLGAPAFYVWPADHLEKVGLKAYAQHPVGTGPYRFLRRVRGQSIDIVRNPDWWDTSGGPYIDTIHYEVFGSVSSMMLAFQKGAIDWTRVPQGQVAASRSLPQVKSGQWKAESTPLLSMRYLFVNMKDPLVGGTSGFALRQALSYGYDPQATIAAVNDGAEVPPTGLVPPGVPGSDRADQPYPYDAAKAAALVKQTGPVTLELVYPMEQQRDLTAESVKAAYASIGITIRLKGLDFNSYSARVFGKKPPQLFFGGWFADYPSMDNFLSPLFVSGKNGYPMSYSNPEVDALLTKARATPTEEARLGLYAEAEQKIMADVPAVPLYAFADYRLLNSRVAGVRFNSMAWADLWRAWVRSR